MPPRRQRVPMTAADAVAALGAAGNSASIEGRARYGIRPRTEQLGVGIPAIRAIARAAIPDHQLALDLWATGIHEARILAAMVDVPADVTAAQMDAWAADFDSWDIVDGCTSELFDRTPYAWIKVQEWAERDEEYVKRAAFSLIAALAVHDRQAPDERFLALLPIIRRHANDDRNFVKKAVNWALRQIGKRNGVLREAAIATAEAIRADGTRSGRWIASDALRELRGRG